MRHGGQGILAIATGILLIFACVVSVNSQKKKEANSLNDKVQQLIDLSTKRSVIRLNGNKFK